MLIRHFTRLLIYLTFQIAITLLLASSLQILLTDLAGAGITPQPQTTKDRTLTKFAKKEATSSSHVEEPQAKNSQK